MTFLLGQVFGHGSWKNREQRREVAETAFGLPTAFRLNPRRPSPCSIVFVAALPLCPHCVTNVSVRADSVVEGRRVHYMCYCARCEYVWEVYQAAPDSIQRRRFSRRRLVVRRKNTLLRGLRDRRKRR